MKRSAFKRPVWLRSLALLILGIGSAIGAFVVFSSPASSAPTCSIYWTGASSTGWSTPDNWSLTNGGSATNRVPGATDFVCMSSVPVRSTVVASSASRTIAGINFAATGTVTPSLELQGGNFKINTNASTINNLALDTGTISGTATVTATGTTQLNGTLTGTGSVVIAAGGTFNLCSLDVDSGYRLLNKGAMTTDLAGCQPVLTNGGIIENAGTWTVTASSTSAYSFFDDGNTANAITNDPGATFTYNTDPTITTTISTAFTNNGTINVTTGTLSLIAGNVGTTTDTGTTAISSGATLDYAGGIRSVTAGSSTGTGTLEVGGANVTFASTVTSTNLDIEGGIVSGSPTATHAVLGGGTLTGTGTLTIPAGGTANLCNTYVDSGYRLLNKGAMTTDLAGCQPVLTNGGIIENAGTWTVTASSTSAYSFFDDGNTANAITNDPGATFTYNTDPTITTTISTAFTNNGTINVTTGTLSLIAGNVGTTTDTGTTAISSGATLDYAGGIRSVTAGSSTGTGTLEVGGANVTFASTVTSTNLDIEGGIVSGSPTATHAVLGGGTLTGTGTLTIPAGGTANLCNTYVDSGYRLLNKGAMTTDLAGCQPVLTNGGIIENAGTWTVTASSTSAYSFFDDGNTANAITNDPGATFTYNTDPTITTTISTAFTNNGTINVTTGTIDLANLTNLTNAGKLTGGTYNVNGGTLTLTQSIVTNSATISLGATGSFSPDLSSITSNPGSLSIAQSVAASGALVNSGTVNVTGGGTVYSVSSYSQSAGSTTVGTGATLKSGASGTAAVAINAGTLTGTGTVQGAVSGAGVFSPGTSGAGTLKITGSYAPAAASTTAVTVGPASTLTQLAVSGAVTVNGKLAITASGAAPAVGTTYTIVTSGSRSGTFASVTGQIIGSTGNFYSVSYSSTAIILTVKPLPVASIAAGTIAEGNSGTTTLTLPVTLNIPAEIAVQVHYATSDGTAAAGSDYTATTGTLTIPIGASSGTISVPVTGDTTYERDETLTVTLSAPANATVGTASATGTVTNDDAPPVVSLGFALTTTSAAGGTPLSFPVTVSGNPSALPLSVSYTATDGTAVAGTDYTATSGTLTIPAGTTFTSISVPVAAQAVYAPQKMLTLTLSNPVDATIGGSNAPGYINNINPTITSVSPSSAPRGTGTSVTITGQNFTSAAVPSVSGGNVSVSAVTVVSSTQITATLTPSSSATLGARDLVLTQGASTTTCTGCVTITSPPIITALSPTSGPPAGGNTVTITGSYFTGATAIKFGTVAATHFTVVSDTQITVTAPAQAAGAHYVYVTTPNGTFSTPVNANKYTYVAPPVVTAIAPTTGPTAGGNTVTITGSGFTGTTGIKFGTVAATSFTVVSDTQLTVVAPAQAAGAHYIYVTTPNGTFSTPVNANKYTYVVPPSVSAISPASGPTAGGNTITITGSGFTGATGVKIGTVATTSFTVVSDTQITAVAPTQAASAHYVIVTTANGSNVAANPSKYTYVAPPAVTAISPATGPTSGGNTVTITGSGLTGATGVKFGNVAATSFTVVSDTQVTAVAPAQAAAVHYVIVTTPHGSNTAGNPSKYTYQ